jgi:hypothetical protein
MATFFSQPLEFFAIVLRLGHINSGNERLRWQNVSRVIYVKRQTPGKETFYGIRQ